MLARFWNAKIISLSLKAEETPSLVRKRKYLTQLKSAIERALDAREYEIDDYLFKSQKGPVLTVPSVHRLVKGWYKAINLKGNYGSHSLRKTWGYHQRVTFGVGLPELMVAFNHSTQRQTLDYLCVQPEEIKNIYQNEL
jgi:integrase